MNNPFINSHFLNSYNPYLNFPHYILIENSYNYIPVNYNQIPMNKTLYTNEGKSHPYGANINNNEKEIKNIPKLKKKDSYYEEKIKN